MLRRRFLDYIVFYCVCFFTQRDMVGKGMMTEICSHHLKFKLPKDDPHLALCLSEPNLFIEASLGFERGLKYCREQFKCHRWNCTNPSRGHDLFGFGMARGLLAFAIVFTLLLASLYFFHKLNALYLVFLQLLLHD